MFRKEKPKVPDGEKWCSICSKSKGIREFSRNRTTNDGLQAYCKLCMSEMRKNYENVTMARNREKWSEIDPYTGKPYDEGS